MEEQQIKKTRNYDKFKFLHGNRLVNKHNLVAITKSVAQHNMLSINPIIVNEKFEIIDGQHRFEISKNNKWPIYYMVLENADIEEVHSFNNVNRKWNTMDYVESYATRGNGNYIRFLKFMSDHEVNFEKAAIGYFNFRSGGIYRAMRAGKMVITDEMEEKAIKRVDFLKALLPFFQTKPIRIEYLMYALNAIIDIGLEEQLIKKLTERDIKLETRTGRQYYLRDFEAILNSKKQSNFVRLF